MKCRKCGQDDFVWKHTHEYGFTCERCAKELEQSKGLK